jgi:hypothetical protein
MLCHVMSGVRRRLGVIGLAIHKTQLEYEEYDITCSILYVWHVRMHVHTSPPRRAWSSVSHSTRRTPDLYTGCRAPIAVIYGIMQDMSV